MDVALTLGISKVSSAKEKGMEHIRGRLSRLKFTGFQSFPEVGVSHTQPRPADLNVAKKLFPEFVISNQMSSSVVFLADLRVAI